MVHEMVPLSLITYISTKNESFFKYIDSYFKNITSIDSFSDYELVIVNTRSNLSSEEDKIIKPYLEKHDNIIRVMVDEVKCQYDAWNIAIQNSSGEYISNTNLDDRRSIDGTNRIIKNIDDNFDVHYGYVNMEMNVDRIISGEHILTKLKYPAFQVNNLQDLFTYNSPHCFPIWKKKLHTRAGWFNIKYTNVGDYEFWLRGCRYYDFKFKYHDVCMGTYFHSPDGLSTSNDTRAAVADENRAMKVLYGRSIKPEYLEIVITGDGKLKHKIKSIK